VDHVPGPLLVVPGNRTRYFREHSKNRVLKIRGTFAVMKNEFKFPDGEYGSHNTNGDFNIDTGV
jgi:hypothetical protein